MIQTETDLWSKSFMLDIRYNLIGTYIISVSEKKFNKQINKECEHMLISHNWLLTYERVHGWLINFYDFVLHLLDHQNIFYCTTKGNL